MQITQDYIKEILHYSIITGRFTWKERLSNRIQVGDVAGTVEGRGYLTISIKGKKYKLHRLAFLYVKGWMPEQVDHINHGRKDNMWINLRESDKLNNKRNQSKRIDNSSGCIGVVWYKRDSTWQAQIQVEGENVHLGRYKDKAEAIKARAEANIKYCFHPNHGN